MDYIFDPAKEWANLAKHGISLAAAEVIFQKPPKTVVDTRFDYG